MEWHEYMSSVKDQIRNKKAKILIEDELYDHFDEQTKAYEDSGMDHETAIKQSIESMGDPIEIGTMFDRVHRPRIDKTFLIIICIISIFTAFLQILVGKYVQHGYEPGEYLIRELLFIVIGVMIMAGIYFADYTILGKCPVLLWILLCCYTLYRVRFNIPLYHCHIDILGLSYLFVPLYAGLLFYFRKFKLTGLFLSAGLGILPTVLFLLGRATSAAFHYSIIAFLMILIVTGKGWFGEHKIRNLFIILSGATLLILCSCIFINSFFLDEYQKIRLHAVFYGNGGNLFSQSDTAFHALRTSKLIGGDGTTIALIPDIEFKYILVFIMQTLGILAGIIVLLVFGFILLKAFHMAKIQKSYLGFIVSLSCALILTEQVVCYVVSNLFSARFSILIGQQYFPFLSGGGRNIVYSFLVTGLLLSVYRNTDLDSNKTISDRIHKVIKVRS